MLYSAAQINICKLNQKAFTLVELATVLVIVGLLVGGVLQGRELIRAAKIQSAVSQLEKYKTAMNTFRSKYNSYPGDFRNAVTFFGGAANGNGDQFVGQDPSAAQQYQEYALFWEHLSKTGLIKESITYNSASLPLCLYSAQTFTNCPIMDLSKNGIVLFQTLSQPIPVAHAKPYGVSADFFVLQSSVNDLNWMQPFESELARDFDMKIDDGVADSGIVLGIGDGGLSGVAYTAGCTSGTAPNIDYDLTLTTKCKLFVKI